MINVAIAIFSLTAILGILLLTMVLKDRNRPKGVLFLHGGLAATGLGLLLIYSFGRTPRPIESIILFLIAASGGIFMGARDLLGKSVPKWLAVGHGLLAVTGFGFLLYFAFA